MATEAAGFERTITELSEPAQTRTIPPRDRRAIAADMDEVMALFEEIGMHTVEESDVLRDG